MAWLVLPTVEAARPADVARRWTIRWDLSRPDVMSQRRGRSSPDGGLPGSREMILAWHAEARDLVGRNVAALVDTPKGQVGRPNKSLSLEQASALLAAAGGTRMHAYIALCLATGIRTEEARALRWEHVEFGDPDARPPVPPSAAVWRSVRAHGDTKTEKSRRTLALPEIAVDALRAYRKRQAGERLAAGAEWSDQDLVFCTRTGSALDAANVRREFRGVCKAAGIGGRWTPRELRHSFVSLMSSSGVPVAEIARIAGHSSTRTTEVVYRRELRPMLTTGAEAMDRLLNPRAS
jgi:integrase